MDEKAPLLIVSVERDDLAKIKGDASVFGISVTTSPYLKDGAAIILTAEMQDYVEDTLGDVL